MGGHSLNKLLALLFLLFWRQLLAMGGHSLSILLASVSLLFWWHLSPFPCPLLFFSL
jgi:hypothetical protein